MSEPKALVELKRVADAYGKACFALDELPVFAGAAFDEPMKSALAHRAEALGLLERAARFYARSAEGTGHDQCA